jgi:hypothetical protein
LAAKNDTLNLMVQFNSPQVPQRGITPILVILITAIIAAGVGILTYQHKSQLTSPKQTACTLEAMICPDGSSVGRTGPKCEFTPCPTPSPSVFVLKIENNMYINKTYNFSVSIPDDLDVVSSGDFVADFFDKKDIDKGDNSPSKRKLRISVNQSERDFGKIYAAKDGKILPEEQHAADAVFTKTRSYIIDGQRAFDYTYDVPDHDTERTFSYGTIIEKENNLIELNTFIEPTTYRQILSTFKFLP